MVFTSAKSEKLMDIRQSEKYASFMKDIGWQVEKIGKWQAFIKKFPLLGSLIKIQRIVPPIPFDEIDKLAQKHRAFKVIVEFSSPHNSPSQPIPDLPAGRHGPQPTTHPHPDNYHICHSPFLPTKTIRINLIPSEKEIFNSFTPEKRRAIRKAQKNGVLIKKGSASEFIYLKRKSLLEKFILPIGDKKDILALEKSFSPENLVFLISFPSSPSNSSSSSRFPRPLAGILLLFYQDTAYYWQAASTKKGKKFFAPSLLVWEALKLSKEKGGKIFNFEGIYDERFPYSSWKGFTKFKQGFSGQEVEFPNPLYSSKFP